MSAAAEPAFVVDYGYIADLCAAYEWGLGLEVLDDGRFRLAVADERPFRRGQILAAVKFAPEQSIDRASAYLFHALARAGVV